jgi:sugar lactone lactonase YvrE
VHARARTQDQRQSHARRGGFAAAVLLAAAASAGCGDETCEPALLVGNTRGDSVSLYDQETGAFLRDFIPAGSGGLEAPDFMLLRDDGYLYISSGDDAESSAVLRFDADTGEPAGVFAKGGGMIRPYGIAFGPDSMLYVASFLSDQILRFDAATGAFVDVFAAGDRMPGGLNGPNGLVFGPDGGLYVTTQGSVAENGMPTFPGLPSQVLRYDISTRNGSVFIDQPAASADSAGFISLLGLVFGPDCAAGACDLFVSDFANDIGRYDPRTGALLDTLPTGFMGTSPRTSFMGGLTFGDRQRLFTVGFDAMNDAMPGTILRFDGATGEPLPAAGQSGAVLVSADTHLRRPIGITAWP